ncbi:MAG: endolytic transglycosylase MltG [Candidatus Absconditabacteria bacterium]
MNKIDYPINLKKIDGQNTNKVKGKKLNIFFLLIFIIISMSVFFLLSLNYVLNKSIYLEEEISINNGDTINILYDGLSSLDKFGFRLYIKINNIDTTKIQEGNYQFNGIYEKEEIINTLIKGPKISYTKVVILEGWNKYDIDEYLNNVGISNKGDYIEAVTNKTLIEEFSRKYEFLNEINPTLTSLEGFLFPNTYNIDINSNLLEELMSLQLASFKKNVWDSFSGQVLSFDDRLNSYNFKKNLNPYGLFIMASIVEKEEKTNDNKALVSGILLNKLEKENRIYADVTLCYGLKMSGKECTPRVIGNNVGDSKNIYNTRKVSGLPPTPIGNPSKITIQEFLNFEKTNYMYYLHDMKGNLHPSENLSEHNYKKSKYLNN